MWFSVQPAVLVHLLILSGAFQASSTPAAQEPATAQTLAPAREQAALPVSLDRIREGITRTPVLTLDSKPRTPTFKTTIEERAVMLPFQEHLRQQLELTPLQRQSQAWASRCCGIDVGQLFKGVEQALERRKARQVREQIRRELAELAAARER